MVMRLILSQGDTGVTMISCGDAPSYRRTLAVGCCQPVMEPRAASRVHVVTPVLMRAHSAILRTHSGCSLQRELQQLPLWSSAQPVSHWVGPGGGLPAPAKAPTGTVFQGPRPHQTGRSLLDKWRD